MSTYTKLVRTKMNTGVGAVCLCLSVVRGAGMGVTAHSCASYIGCVLGEQTLFPT